MLFFPSPFGSRVSHQIQRYTSNLSSLSEGYSTAPRGAHGAGLDAAAADLAGGGGDRRCFPGQGVELRVQAGLVAGDQEGDKLRRFRALLPCEVVVTAVTHPLHGCRLRAYALRHVDGVPHLKVELPDGLPGLVAVAAADVPGSEQAAAGTGLVLDGAGLRRLYAVVMRRQERDTPGG